MLKVTEIFYSLQGETRFVGLPTVFIRLTGCPLRCGYCDTAYAFSGGENLEIADIIQKTASFNTRYVTVTGGEPLAQKACIELLTQLCDQGFTVSLETSGALDVSQVDARVSKVIDFKTPGSLEVKRNLFDNINYVTSNDQIKFVICDQNDYVWAKEIIQKYHLFDKCEVLFSPSYQQQSLDQLADWILADQLPVRFQVQLHKMIWGDQPGK